MFWLLFQKKALVALKKQQSSTSQTSQSGLKRSRCFEAKIIPISINVHKKLSMFFFFFFQMNICIPALSDQPVIDTATATEQAKMLIKSGAISAIKSENKNSGFKRSRMLEIKLKVQIWIMFAA